MFAAQCTKEDEPGMHFFLAPSLGRSVARGEMPAVVVWQLAVQQPANGEARQVTMSSHFLAGGSAHTDPSRGGAVSVVLALEFKQYQLCM